MSIKRILISDDEPYVTRVLKLVLRKEGYDVECVNNGKQALDSYLKERPEIIITDVKMPHMTGRELVEAIRKTNGDTQTPIIVMTSTLESENRDWVTAVNNVSFIGKPVSPREMVRLVEMYLTLSEAS